MADTMESLMKEYRKWELLQLYETKGYTAIPIDLYRRIQEKIAELDKEEE